MPAEPLKITALDKVEAFAQVADFLIARGYKITNLDIMRPWGFYFYIDEDQIAKFTAEFYGRAKLEGIDASLPLQPKIMVVQPGHRLSWQYHNRRSEIWKCLCGPYRIVTSPTDGETAPKRTKPGDVVTVRQGTRHRCIADDDWAVFAEIWQHTEPKNPSNEDDIVRLQDDYGRH